MNQENEVIAPFGMRELVDENCVQFGLAKQVLNAAGQRDVRMENSIHSRSVIVASEPDRDAVSEQIRSIVRKILRVEEPGIATIGAYPQIESGKH